MSNTREDAESPPLAVDDKIFVAVPEELKHGKSNLLWALHNLARDASSSRIAIAHVHVPCSLYENAGDTLLQSFEDVESTFKGKPRRLRSLEDFTVDSGRSQTQNSDSSCPPNDGAASICCSGWIHL